LISYLTGQREEKIGFEAYPRNNAYMNELITRANTLRILSRFMDNCISNDKELGFLAVTDVSQMLKECNNGDYASFADFEKRFTELYIGPCHKFCTGN